MLLLIIFLVMVHVTLHVTCIVFSTACIIGAVKHPGKGDDFDRLIIIDYLKHGSPLFLDYL